MGRRKGGCWDVNICVFFGYFMTAIPFPFLMAEIYE